MAREEKARRVALLGVTDARTSLAHLVTDEAMAAGRPQGRYRAVCGCEVLASSLTAEESGYCRSCRAVTGGGRRG
ncbi:MAG TPA: hypothetical protein VHH34_17455 [Pseudonocardiaceae bacterium]|nr:hypothetical protein [Pseudonocardiaceae bacterium]